jgi:galactokinase
MPNAESLRKLLEARYEWEHSEIELKPEREKIYLLLFDEMYREVAAAKELSKHTFGDAIDYFYRSHRAARRKAEMGSVPPSQRGQ